MFLSIWDIPKLFRNLYTTSKKLEGAIGCLLDGPMHIRVADTMWTTMGTMLGFL